MNLNFETKLYGNGELENFDDPSALLIDLGNGKRTHIRAETCDCKAN